MTYYQLIIDTIGYIMNYRIFNINNLLDRSFGEINFYTKTLNYPKIEELNINWLTNNTKEDIKNRIFEIELELDKFKIILKKDKSKDKIKKIINDYNKWIKIIKEWYKKWEKRKIEEYFNLMVETTIYDYFFTKNFKIEYNEENKIMIIDYELPDVDNFPKVKEIKELRNWEEREILFSKTELNEIYEKYIYSICIRIVYEIFLNDKKEYIDSIVFNGFIKTINKTNWHKEIFYTTSLQAKKDEIININLKYIDPKETFKSLRWMSATKLSSLTPIKPILTMDKNDKRIAEWYNVIDWIDTATNLAAMDRQDFENLIRDLFEKIYSKNGWEVKVTQASKDWWIDAIAFDPNPITWWKTVIQAKRYTNIVWVSAVRDLYGTIMNEWAMKWILVTTSNFGSDSYSFVKDKPISLITWANLLHLLKEHWYNAKIDIEEAREILGL